MQNETNEKLIYRPEFIPFRPEMMKSYGLSLIDTILYGFVRFYLTNNPENKFYFTNVQLAEMLNTSEATITRSMKNLSKIRLFKTNYLQRAGGGTIRCVSLNFQLNLLQNPTSQIDELDSSKRRGNNNKINKNNNNIAASAAEVEKKETDLQKVVNFFFQLKSWDYRDPKLQATYRRYLRPAQELLKIFNTVEDTNKAVFKVFHWAKQNNLEWGLDTVIKKIPELETLGTKKVGVIKTHTGEEAICINGKWVRADDHKIAFDLDYYPELAKH